MLDLISFVFGVCVSTCISLSWGGLWVFKLEPFGRPNRVSVEWFGEACLGWILVWFLEVSWFRLKFTVQENWMAMTRWRGLR